MKSATIVENHANVHHVSVRNNNLVRVIRVGWDQPISPIRQKIKFVIAPVM